MNLHYLSNRVSVIAGFLLSLCFLFSYPLHAVDTSPDSNAVEGNATDETAAKEVVNILGTTYEVPTPWRGNRIIAPAIPLNEFRQIPTEHTKDGAKIYIVKQAHAAFLEMAAAALEEGILLQVESGYRSLNYQERIFGRMLSDGRTFEDIIRYVAPPGYSQHALGTALDFSPSNWRFAELPAYDWLHENGERFGFSETYSEKNSLHYPWESWHWNFTATP